MVGAGDQELGEPRDGPADWGGTAVLKELKKKKVTSSPGCLEPGWMVWSRNRTSLLEQARLTGFPRVFVDGGNVGETGAVERWAGQRGARGSCQSWRENRGA